MNASHDVSLITDGEAMGRQGGRGSQVAFRGFVREGRTGGRGSSKNFNYFICGKEGHFSIACLDTNRVIKETVNHEVNLISSSEARVFVVTKSKLYKNVVIDNRLSTTEDHKEAENSRDKGKKVSRD